MDANIRRPLPGPVAPLALKSESLQEVAQFEAFAQNLLNHEQGACRSTAAIWGRPGERRVLAQPGRAGDRPAGPLTWVVWPFSGVLRVSAVQRANSSVPEQLNLNQRVAGSSPVAPTNKSKAYRTIMENHQIIIRTVSANWSRAERRLWPR